jgi:DNA-binding transcriptional MerR regulator
MASSTGYLTLKRAAQMLGVHEQTLRSWEHQGLIRLARLPKSGYRRVPVDEVQRLQAVMLAGNRPSEVKLSPPPRDAATLALAHTLAATVRAELATLETETTFDQFLQTRRGRA